MKRKESVSNLNFTLKDKTILNTRELVNNMKGDKTEDFHLTCYRLYGLEIDFFSSQMYRMFNLVDDQLCIIAYLKRFRIGGTVSMQVSEIGRGYKIRADAERKFNAGTNMFIIDYGNQEDKQWEKEVTSLISIFTGEEFIHNYCFTTQVMKKGYVQRTP